MRWIVFIITLSISTSLWAQPVSDTNNAAEAESQLRATVDNQVAARLEAFEKKLEGFYLNRLEALDIQRTANEDVIKGNERTISYIFYAVVAAGALVVAAGALVGFFGWRTVTGIQRTVKNRTEELIKGAIKSSNKDGEELSGLLEKVKKTSERLEKIEEELSGYTALRDVAKVASGFDPLATYKEMDLEIDKRAAKAREDGIDVSETVNSTEFRQRAAVVFQKLLKAAQDDWQKNPRLMRLDYITLFNAAKNASKIDMDFVALEFMELASEVSRGSKPEVEAALIRQKLTMSRYNNLDDVWTDLGSALEKTSGFDLHLVASEVFNVGIHTSDVVRAADLLSQKTRDTLKNASYTKIIEARLMFYGGETPKDWARGEAAFCAALTAFAQEPSSVRWYQHTARDIEKVVSENPGIVGRCDGKP